MSAFFERPLCLHFTAKIPKSKAAEFYRNNLKVFRISKNTDTVFNFCYLAIKLPNFKPVDEKLPKLEPRVSHSFDIKIVSRKKRLKVLAFPQTHFR